MLPNYQLHKPYPDPHVPPLSLQYGQGTLHVVSQTHTSCVWPGAYAPSAFEIQNLDDIHAHTQWC